MKKKKQYNFKDTGTAYGLFQAPKSYFLIQIKEVSS